MPMSAESIRAMIVFTFLEWMLSAVGRLDDVFRHVGRDLRNNVTDSLNYSESSTDSGLTMNFLNYSGSFNVQTLRQCVDKCLSIIPA